MGRSDCSSSTTCMRVCMSTNEARERAGTEGGWWFHRA